MSQWGYVALGWSLALAILIGYVVSLLARGRSLSRRVPPEEQRWM